MSTAGVLYVVATPIGNLSDITVRAIEVLRGADLIACEDTRTSRVLLHHWEISTRLISLHKFSETRKSGAILGHLSQGRNVALICDAGTPAISDPGGRLVAAVLKSGFRVCPIPGPSSVVAALSVSGLDASSFYWGGFVPKSEGRRRAFFEDILGRRETSVVFETPARILTTLASAAETLGERRMVLCRELTKLHEEILSGSAQELLNELAARGSVKGEIVVVIEGKPAHAELLTAEEAVKALLREGYSGKTLAIEAKKRFGISRTDAYEGFLKLKKEDFPAQ
ncbi:MAG: 16S rRNA (cytidine(1402)-2'-O)-methyltransferase [Thermodesulfobacteriota bacterium]